MTPCAPPRIESAERAAVRLAGALSARGLPTDLQEARGTVAVLCGHGGWSALETAVRLGRHGYPDSALPILDGEIGRRRRHARDTLRSRHGLTDGEASEVARLCAATGSWTGEADDADAVPRRSTRSPSERYLEACRLGPIPEDQRIRDALLEAMGQADRAVRQAARILPMHKIDIHPFQPFDTLCSIRAVGSQDVLVPFSMDRWMETPAAGEFAALLDEAMDHAGRAWTTAWSIGPAPLLSAHSDFFLRTSFLGNGMPRTPECDVTLGLAGSIQGRGILDAELPARDWANAMVGARRVLLDHGWQPDGDPWVVHLRVDGRSSEAMPVLARDAADAVTRVAASTVIRHRLFTRHDPAIRIVRVEGPDGEADSLGTFHASRTHALWAHPLLRRVRIGVHADAHRPTVEWKPLSMPDVVLVAMRRLETPEWSIPQGHVVAIPRREGLGPVRAFSFPRQDPDELLRAASAAMPDILLRIPPGEVWPSENEGVVYWPRHGIPLPGEGHPIVR